jgi:hypothetical protein
VRVDTHLDDKDLREKFRIMDQNNYTPGDVGVPEDFCLLDPNSLKYDRYGSMSINDISHNELSQASYNCEAENIL